MGTTYMPINKWIGKECVVYINVLEHFSAKKIKKRNLAICGSIDECDVHYAKWYKPDIER